jgi:predicted nucleotidyltransferase
MVNIEEIKDEIVEALKPLKPDKIILFGSYAYGKPDKDSDIDLFLLKDDLRLEYIREYIVEAKIRLLKIYEKYQTNGIDILAASTEYIQKREDYFYKVDILQNGRVLYEQDISNRVA